MWERDPGANTNVDYSIYIPKRDLWPSERCSGSLARFFVHAFLVLFTGRVRDLFFFFVLLFLFMLDLSVCRFLSLSFLLFVFLCLGLFLSLVVLGFVKGVLFSAFNYGLHRRGASLPSFPFYFQVAKRTSFSLFFSISFESSRSLFPDFFLRFLSIFCIRVK